MEKQRNAKDKGKVGKVQRQNKSSAAASSSSSTTLESSSSVNIAEVSSNNAERPLHTWHPAKQFSMSRNKNIVKRGGETAGKDKKVRVFFGDEDITETFFGEQGEHEEQEAEAFFEGKQEEYEEETGESQ